MTDQSDVTTPSDREIRVQRRFAASAQHLFDCHTKPDLLQRWLLGPPGWTMPECEVDLRVGGAYRYLWRSEDGANAFGSEGRFLEIEPGRRLVSTERMTGLAGAPRSEEAQNTVTFEDQPSGGMVLTTLMVFPSKAVRDMALQSGMTRGMDQSYDRMIEVVLNQAVETA